MSSGIVRIFYLVIISGLLSCVNNNKENIPEFKDSFFFYEPCMIVNSECNNRTEGNYLKVIKAGDNNNIHISPLQNHNLNVNWEHWALGWGTGKALYDAGSENLRAIKNFDPALGYIELGEILRGEGFPVIGDRIVLWNRRPSGFAKYKQGPVISPDDGFKNFAGKSLMFSTIIFNKQSEEWVMFINEVDTSKISMYAAVSKDLKIWKPALNGNPLFTEKDFSHTEWAGYCRDGILQQSALITDIIQHKGKWHFIMNSYNKKGERQIGVVTSDNLLEGPFDIPVQPAIKTGEKDEWDAKGVFYGKVIKQLDTFKMFYDGIWHDRTERLGMAWSEDLKTWHKYSKNPVIDDHVGWRSRTVNSEPAWVGNCGSNICLLISGSKNFKMGPWHNYISKRMYKDVSGNVDDMHLGLYWSSDGGKTFHPHLLNPLFVNDYADEDENEHLGGSINFINKNDTLFLFYLGKTTEGGLRYQPLIRYKTLDKADS